MTKAIQLFATLKEISYSKTLRSPPLPKYHLEDLKDNLSIPHSTFILDTDKESYSFSQWVSPKRTRSFPYARIYDSLGSKNRVTIIPFCKDEGFDGDRDFIQWDTVSLMNLLNVYTIIGYYVSATKNIRPKQIDKNKITNQKYNYAYIAEQINKLESYQSDALHWNLKQLEQELPHIANLTIESYHKISEETGVKLHSEDGIRSRCKIILKDINEFKDLSRELAKQAQKRESLTIQPKEEVRGIKVKINMKNLLGGNYFMTSDEGFLLNNKFYLIEMKHSSRKMLPSINDIKDGIIKMILYTNIDKLELNGHYIQHRAILGLTSAQVTGDLHSNMSSQATQDFITLNNFSTKERNKLLSVIEEAKENQFGLFVINPRSMRNQKKILSNFE